eukprot:scaffold22727_cov58-Phaeocystis_antarctica.AAC.9
MCDRSPRKRKMFMAPVTQVVGVRQLQCTQQLHASAWRMLLVLVARRGRTSTGWSRQCATPQPQPP